MTGRSRAAFASVVCGCLILTGVGVVGLATPAVADTVIDGCTIVSSPTPYLAEANLTGADLDGADLTGARDMGQATWSNTTCPNGTNSNRDGDTCVNNL